MDLRAALIEETAALGELIRGADPATPVPTCPDWTLRQLFRHVGRGNRWAAQIVADRRDTPLDPRDVREGRPPDDPDAAVDWLNAGAQLILDSVDDLERHLAEIAERSIKSEAIVDASKGVRTCAVTDPDGNTINFIGGFRVDY